MTTSPARNPRFSQVIGEAIALEMEADSKVLVLGEDIGRSGGVFGVTRELQARSATVGVAETSANLTEIA